MYAMLYLVGKSNYSESHEANHFLFLPTQSEIDPPKKSSELEEMTHFIMDRKK